MHRRLLIALPIALLSSMAMAQDAFSVEIIREHKMPRDQIFDNAALWLAESIRSSKAAIELNDKDIGTIIGNVSADLKIGWAVYMPIQFKLRIDVKDNRYRMTFSQVKILAGSSLKPIESANRDSLEPKARDLFEQLATSFQDYLAASAKSKAW